MEIQPFLMLTLEWNCGFNDFALYEHESEKIKDRARNYFIEFATMMRFHKIKYVILV